jgi:hypothetical protein
MQVINLIMQFSSFIGSNILRSVLFWHMLRKYASLTVKDQAPYRTKLLEKLLYLYILIFFLNLDNRLEDKRFCVKC